MSLRNPDKIKWFEKENDNRIFEQTQKEINSIKKFRKGSELLGFNYMIVYDGYTEMYTIDSYGNMGKVKKLDVVNLDMIKQLGYTEF